MKKVLSLLLLFGMIMAILQGGVAAEAASRAKASSAVQQSATTATFKLTAVRNSTDANTGTALALTVMNRQGFFYLKNFGTTPLNGFSMTQSRSTSTVRYCIGQNFKPGDATTCLNNTAAIVVGRGSPLNGVTFTTPLAPGAFYAFSSAFTTGSSNTVNVSVSRANITTRTTVS